MKDITVLEAIAKTHNGEGYMIVRNPVEKGKPAIEFHEVRQ